MKIWMAFLLGSFIVGGMSIKRGKPERARGLVFVSAAVAVLMYTGRFG
jgi:hypothetical protein